jgi:hypothetical protein
VLLLLLLLIMTMMTIIIIIFSNTNLVDGGVGGEEVEVRLALHVPHVHAPPTRQHHGDGVVVVRAVAILPGDSIHGATSANHQLYAKSLKLDPSPFLSAAA